MRYGFLGLALLLCGCAAAGGEWVKPGGDTVAVAADYRECQGVAAAAVKKDTAIDQDILATRQSDWQRASIVRLDVKNMHEETRDRAAAIVASCMRAKGYAKAP